MDKYPYILAFVKKTLDKHSKIWYTIREIRDVLWFSTKGTDMGQNRSGNSTDKWNKLLNSPTKQGPLKTGGGGSGVGRIEKT